MGQKVNPHGLRVGVIKDWDSRWCVKDEVFGDVLVSDYNIRKLLKKELFKAGVLAFCRALSEPPMHRPPRPIRPHGQREQPHGVYVVPGPHL